MTKSAIAAAGTMLLLSVTLGCDAPPRTEVEAPARPPGLVFPERPFTAPAGPHAVGTREYAWTDSARAERYTTDPDDRRRVVAQVWYPAAGAGDTARYLQRPEEFADTAGGNAARGVRTNSVQDAAVAASDAGWPVLLYNHGGGWTRWSATFATEWLASHGYVVVSVEHFGFNQTTRCPDGAPFAADTLRFPTPTGDFKADALASWDYLESPVFEIWRDDARFALDQVERLARETGPFQGRLDLDKVGALGWSFGGALAVELSAVDPRVRAAVDQDGQLFGEVKARGTERPVLQFHGGGDPAAGVPEEQRAGIQELMAHVKRTDSATRARSSGDWYSLEIAGATHGDFSDLSLFFPRADGAPDPRRVHEIINAYTLAFFDHYLKGKPASLLSQSPSPYAEAAFERR
jgi:predicted dienelactone hydrolase